MADSKITQLTAITTVDTTDVLPIVDLTDVTTKKVTIAQIAEQAPVQSVASKTGAVTLVKGDVGLGNVDNTSDANKPISTATQTALNAKQDSLVSGTNIKTLEGQSLLGSGNIDLSKSDVGLSNVDNTSDANKPISTATQTALDTKTAKLITTNRQTASYTLVLSDADKLVEMNVGSANNLTIPLNSSVAFPIGTQILLAQYGAGQTTIVATSGVTVRSNGGKLKLNVQYSGATLIKIATDEWYLFGDIA